MRMNDGVGDWAVGSRRGGPLSLLGERGRLRVGF